MRFITGSDGNGASHLRVAAGMFRTPSSDATRQVTPREGGNARSDEQLFMNGPEIFNFTLREIPNLVRTALDQAGWSIEQVDAIVMHQANRFMLDYLAKRMKLPAEKVVLALERYGNTSSASIPLAICDQLRPRLDAGPAKVLLAGFGVGFSWAASTMVLDHPFIAPVTVY
jgi:3-oxoacyl-[acyl-carrier-protein] synthase-3